MRRMLVIASLLGMTGSVLATDPYYSSGWEFTYGQPPALARVENRPSLPPYTYIKYFLAYYTLENGQPHRKYWLPNGNFTDDPSYSPYGLWRMGPVPSSSPWNGNLEGLDFQFESQRIAAYIAKLMSMPFDDLILKYLQDNWPNGVSDPNFEEAFKQFAERSGPETVAREPPFKNSSGLTVQGDPVFVSNGEYRLSVTDGVIAGRALAVQLTRTYGSRRDYNGRFGYGWDMNYNMKVRRLAVSVGEPNLIVLLDGGGCRRTYTQQTGDPNLYVRSEDRSDHLYDVNGTLTLVEKSGLEYQFDGNGNLSAITDENGNHIGFTYDPNGLMDVRGPSNFFESHPKYGLVAKEYELKTITDDLGRQIHLAYNANGLLSNITDFSGRTWTYSYGAATNDLLSVEDPNGFVTQYGYDYLHNLTTITDPSGQRYITNEYHPVDDRVLTQEYGYGTYVFDYNDADRVAVTTDREGYRTKIVYSDNEQILSETVYTADPNADPNSFTTYHFYDPNTLERIRTIPPDGTCVDYTYDDLANLMGVYRKVSPSDPNSRGDPNVIATTFTYDTTHVYDINSITDPMGNTTYFQYDLNRNVIRLTYPAVMVHGYAQPQTPVVRYTYNGHGQVDTMTAPDGIVTKYLYYSDANPSDPNCSKLWKTIVDYNSVEGLNITTEYAYDAYGNIRQVSDPNGDVTRLAYNELNLPTRTVSPLGHVTLFTYNPNKKVAKTEREIAGPNQVSNFTYDILDHVKTSTDPLGYVTHYSYTRSEEPNTVTDAENHSTTSIYNERGLPVQVLDANDDPTTYAYTANGDANDVKDAKSNRTRYEYDKFGRLIRITYPDDSFEAFTYDKNSNILSRTQRNGDIIRYQYDALKRLRVKSRPGEPNLVYTYDLGGRIYDVNDGGQVTEYYYDGIGRVTDVNDPEDRVVSYEYDNRGLRTKLTYPDNSYITYEYDAEGKLRRIRDDSSRTLARYDYDDLGRRTLLTLGNDANVVYEYDLANRLTKLTNHIDDTNSIAFAYDNYDHVGNRLSLKIDSAPEQVYAYDAVYRLTSVDYGDGNDMDFYYDALGNRRRTINGGTVNYQTNSLNQYTSVGGSAYTYDDNGNLAFDGRFHYYYDCENRLLDVNDAAHARVASYAYDYLGRRISKTIYGTPNVTIRYAYDGDQILAEYDGSGTLLRKFVYGPGLDEPICLIDVANSNAAYYYHLDGLGSVVALSNVNNMLVERYAYDVFGRPTIRDPNGVVLAAGARGNPYLFTGRAWDVESGLYYYRARYYDYATGRFLQPDPVGYQAGINLYEYCSNNAVNFIDPSGEWVETAWDVANVVIGAGSLVNNVRQGNWTWAALDAAGLAYDAVATAVPFLPGGASAAWKARRAGNTLAQSAKVGLDVAKIAKWTDRAARIVDNSLDDMAYGRMVHNKVGKDMYGMLRELLNFCPIGRANRRTGPKPDFPGVGLWVDVTTTLKEWREHLKRYPAFGEGIAVLYRRGEGVWNMKHLYAAFGLGLLEGQWATSKK